MAPVTAYSMHVFHTANGFTAVFDETWPKSSVLWVTGPKSSVLFLMGTKSSVLLVLCTLAAELRNGGRHPFGDCTLRMDSPKQKPKARGKMCWSDVVGAKLVLHYSNATVSDNEVAPLRPLGSG
eukprot:COSAG01_NODE_620_length_14784_cov_49.916718_3_plen_124_part_00